MDALITASARALAVGDPVGALKHVALRDDAAALALRGIAMAQLGELERARQLLRRATRSFGRHQALARARCAVAEAEVALAMRELGGRPRGLLVTAALLEEGGDAANAAQARLIAVRRLLLLGRLQEAAEALSAIEVRRLGSPARAAAAALAAAEIALRTMHTGAAQEAIARAQAAAQRSGIPALLAEVGHAQTLLERPAARRWRLRQEATPLRLAEVQALLTSGAFVVDGCRRGLRCGPSWVPLARRPVLFTLARALAQAWPAPVARADLIEQAFALSPPDDTHRARLRVELGRLRALAEPLARIEATDHGYALVPRGWSAFSGSDGESVWSDSSGATSGQQVAVLLPPIEGDAASMQALLADGAAWSTSALALALGESQRTVQRALGPLQAAGQVRSIGRGRAQRWLAAPLSEITTILLLPGAAPFV